MTISSSVDRPDTLNCQSRSLPNTSSAAIQATVRSNNLRARKNVITTAASKINWLKMAIKKSGW